MYAQRNTSGAIGHLHIITEEAGREKGSKRENMMSRSAESRKKVW
jgi:hypothetical protein